MNFCAAILTLKMEEDTHLGVAYFITVREVRMKRETHTDVCKVWRRPWDSSNVSDVVCEVSCTTDVFGRMFAVRLSYALEGV